MSKSQLSLGIEPNAMYLVQLELDDEGKIHVHSKHEFKFGFDLYTEVLQTGRSKGMISVMNDLIPALGQYATEYISITINVNYTKWLVSYIEKDLDSTLFKQCCDDEASKFLSQPSDYSWQAIPLNDCNSNPYDTVMMVFMPKRFINRLQMMILPSGKKINLIDGSHMSLHSLLPGNDEPFGLLEIEKDYMALSLIQENGPHYMSYRTLSSEADLAYHAITELNKYQDFKTILSTGEASSSESMKFISSTLQKEMHELKFPENIQIDCSAKDCSKYYKAIGSGIKALNVFS